MDYEKQYRSLVERAKNRVLDCYTETHHIIPKSIGGLCVKDNLVDLTSREHFIAHLLLTKIYKGTEHESKLLWAYNSMCNWKSGTQERNYKINSHLFEKLKGKYKHTEETKKKISKSNKDKILTYEHKKKISDTRKYRIDTCEIDRPIGVKNGMFGKKHSEETKKQMSKDRLGRKIENTENYSKPGSNNGNAKVIYIFDDKDNLMFETNGNFKSVCEYNNLPYAPLYRSYKNNTKLFQNKASVAQAKKSGMIKYQGWYSKLIKKGL